MYSAAKDSVEIPEVSYEQLCDGMKKESFLLLDVRTPAEVQAGKIPASKPIPVDELESALKLSPTDFKNKYGFDMPSHDDKIVTHCKAGGRALRACNMLYANNYHNVASYKPGWTEWAVKHPEDVKTPPQ